MKNKHDNNFERCQVYPINIRYFVGRKCFDNWTFFFSSVATIGIFVCEGLFNEDEIDLTDVLIVGIEFLRSTVEVTLAVKVGNFFAVVVEII
jgi:hypothetical protein